MRSCRNERQIDETLAWARLADHKVFKRRTKWRSATHAACSMNSTLIASNGNMILPPSVRSRTPTFSSAVTSPCTALTSRPTRRAASRMDTGPMPHGALSNSHRVAFRTCQSNSGDANAMRADFQHGQSSRRSRNLPSNQLAGEVQASNTNAPLHQAERPG